MRDQVIDVTARPGIDFGVQVSDESTGARIVGISMDNVMLDGTSMMIALAQLDHLYRGGSVDELPSLKTSFAHYVRSHPELWPDADESALPQLAASRDYWRARLPSLPPAPELAPMQAILDIDKPVFERVEAAVAASRLGEGSPRHAGPKGSPRRRSCWPTTHGCWLSGPEQPHFCVNVTLFDRDPGVPGIEDVIGDFTSLLLLECHVDATVSIWEQARRLQRQLITDLPHRTADAVWLQRELLRHHGRPADAVFPVVFTSGLGLIDTSGRSSFDFGELGIRPLPDATDGAGLPDVGESRIAVVVVGLCHAGDSPGYCAAQPRHDGRRHGRRRHLVRAAARRMTRARAMNTSNASCGSARQPSACRGSGRATTSSNSAATRLARPGWWSR